MRGVRAGSRVVPVGGVGRGRLVDGEGGSGARAVVVGGVGAGAGHGSDGRLGRGECALAGGDQ